jgi:hypothetical protein
MVMDMVVLDVDTAAVTVGKVMLVAIISKTTSTS